MSPTANAQDEDPDLSLLRAFAAGDVRAGRQLLDRIAPRLHSLLMRLLNDRAEAEDICQESFLKLWQSAADWQPRARVSTWLHQIALNAARDRLRRRRPQVAVDEDLLLASSAAGPEHLAEQDQRQRQLQRALLDLPERQREAILLCHIEQHSQREAAAILQISTAALESLLSRARDSLRVRLAELARPASEPLA